MRSASFFLIMASIIAFFSAQASAEQLNTTWSLTKEEKKNFLHHYSPIIFKRADEPGRLKGHDLISNYFFDGDYNFANNRRKWKYDHPFGKDSKDDKYAPPGLGVGKDLKHEFIVHQGSKENWVSGHKVLKHDSNWHLSENGGFDGRWIQIFDDCEPKYDLDTNGEESTGRCYSEKSE